MTHRQLIGIAGLGILVAIGCGVFTIHRHTSFLAGVIQDNMAEAAAHMAELSSQVAEEVEESFPIGFHTPKGNTE